MSQQLINHSPDLKRLRDEGFAIEVKGGYLCIHQIPYVNQNKEIKSGTLVTALTLAGNKTTKPKNHVIFFAGDHPCNKDGSIISAIKHGSSVQTLTEGVTVHHAFSNKPTNGYTDYYHKVTTYCNVIVSQARSLDSSVTERTFAVILDNDDESVFHYIDTNASRGNVVQINSKFKGQKIAIIGMGGTGAYLLDLITKTPVEEIHIYDGDAFLQHNAFRSPGAASTEMLEQKINKAVYYGDIYSKMHKKIIVHDYYVTTESVQELQDKSFVFTSLDNDSAKRMIIQYLLNAKVSFIDVGLGVNIVDDKLIGIVRTTTGTSSKNDHLDDRISFAEENNDYATNVQIADLNCLNAVLAILKWKKLSGFYQDYEQEYHTTYSINVGLLRNEDRINC